MLRADRGLAVVGVAVLRKVLSAEPTEVDRPLIAGIAFLVTFFSASQDIVVDAYRREDLADEELGLGSALYVNGYRIGMLLAGGGGLIMADLVSFATVYLLLGLTMLVGKGKRIKS